MKSKEKIVFEALEKAKEAFWGQLKDLDIALDIRFTVWLLTKDFERWIRIEIEDEVK